MDYDRRLPGPADPVLQELTPELLVCAALMYTGGYDGAGCAVLQGSMDRWGLASTDDEFRDAAELQFSRWQGPGPECYESGRPVLTSDLREPEHRWPLIVASEIAASVRAFAVFPLRLEESVIGLCAVYRREARPFDAEDVDLIQATAVTLSALVRTRLSAEHIHHDMPRSDVAVAVGLVSAAHGIGPADSLAMLRAFGFAHDMTVGGVARDLVSGRLTVDDVVGPA